MYSILLGIVFKEKQFGRTIIFMNEIQFLSIVSMTLKKISDPEEQIVKNAKLRFPRLCTRMNVIIIPQFDLNDKFFIQRNFIFSEQFLKVKDSV